MGSSPSDIYSCSCFSCRLTVFTEKAEDVLTIGASCSQRCCRTTLRGPAVLSLSITSPTESGACQHFLHGRHLWQVQRPSLSPGLPSSSSLAHQVQEMLPGLQGTQ